MPVDDPPELLTNAGLREKMGKAARERVRNEFLGIRHLLDYAALLEKLIP